MKNKNFIVFYLEKPLKDYGYMEEKTKKYMQMIIDGFLSNLKTKLLLMILILSVFSLIQTHLQMSSLKHKKMMFF